jgi:uncharacterized protein (TIGR02391 family)
MDILLSEHDIRQYFDQYIDFLVERVVRLYGFCANKLGATHQDYAGRVEMLEFTYKALMEDVPTIDVSPLRSLCRNLRNAISQLQNLDQAVEACEKVLRNFIYNDEVRFRQAYLEAKAAQATREMYSDHLFFAIDTHLRSGNYDAAIGEAFKCLDRHLQKLLGLSPNDQLFGESLINRAFAPDAGPLQTKSDPNEQKGLRNFASGANGIFRNPVAHRSVFNRDLETLAKYLLVPVSERPPNFYDKVTAQTAIAVVAFLMKVSTVLALKNDIITREEAREHPFGV